MNAGLWAGVLVVFMLDRISKIAALRFLPPYAPVPIWPPFLHFTHIRNYGAAFGIFQQRAFFLIAAGIGLLLLLWWLRKDLLSGPFGRWGIVFLLGGDLGNLCDRLSYGGVIDFIQLPHWPIFNVADMSINLGIALLLWHLWQREKTNHAS